MGAMVYHAIVRSKVRRLWQRVGSGHYEAAVALASPRLHFRFAGGPPLGADLHGPDEFRRWFAGAFALLPGLRMTLTDMVVQGWPWNTTVVVRLAVSATLSDGTPYANEAVQWVRLRWGQMTDDYVLEDTARLADAARRQEAAARRRRCRGKAARRRRAAGSVTQHHPCQAPGPRSPAAGRVADVPQFAAREAAVGWQPSEASPADQA